MAARPLTKTDFPQSPGIPIWTERQQKSGLDPLGMQSTSIALYQSLLPGISNITLRMRYYGFYAWLASVYARDKGMPDKKAWQVFVRRAEALLALTVAHHGEETGIAGIAWARERWAEVKEAPAATIDFRHDALPPTKDDSTGKYLKQASGAFGAAYVTQMTLLDILSDADQHEIAVPSADIGDALAASFQDSLGPVATTIIQAIDAGKVSLEALERFAPLLPSLIDSASTERQHYEDLLFARTGPQEPQHAARRDTLLLMLSVARQWGSVPSQDDIRWALYAGYLKNGQRLRVPASLEDCRDAWWVYQLNDLAQISVASLLRFILQRLAAYPGGIALEELLARVVREILGVAPSAPATWGSLLESIPPVANAWSTEESHAEHELAKPLRKLERKEKVCPATTAWCALQLLAVVYQRAQAGREIVDRHLGNRDPAIIRSIHTEAAFLESRLTQPLEDTLHELLERRVIQRHLWVALRKLRYQKDYTYLLEVEEGQVRQRALSAPVFTNPRFKSALKFLRDIGLTDDTALTPLGERCLEELT